MVADIPLPFVWPQQDYAPDRPALDDDDVLRLAAEMATDRIIAEWPDGGFEGDDREEVVEALLEAMNGYDQDGYSLARQLESEQGWSPDAQLVDILDRGYQHDAKNALIKQWVSVYGIQPCFNVGDEVGSPYGNVKITAIYTETAEYVIDTGRSQLVVSYEKVIPLPAKPEA